MNWSDADTKLCKMYDYNYGKRFTKIAKDDPNSLFVISEDPWCVSCYAYYKDVCSNISKIFKIRMNSNKTWKLKDLQDGIEKLFVECEDLTIRERVEKLKSVLYNISICLREKLNHHKYCYRPKPNVKNIGNTIGDPEHDGFFVDMCKELSKIYALYRQDFDFINERKKVKNEPLIPEIIQIEFSDVFRNCYNRYRVLEKASENDKYVIYNNLWDGIELTFKQKSMLNIELSQNKDYQKENPKRSHNKKFYKIKKRSGEKKNYKPKNS